MEHGVPVRKLDVVGPDLAQDLGGVDEEKDDDLQRVGDHHPETAL